MPHVHDTRTHTCKNCQCVNLVRLAGLTEDCASVASNFSETGDCSLFARYVNHNPIGNIAVYVHNITIPTRDSPAAAAGCNSIFFSRVRLPCIYRYQRSLWSEIFRDLCDQRISEIFVPEFYTWILCVTSIVVYNNFFIRQLSGVCLARTV